MNINSFGLNSTASMQSMMQKKFGTKILNMKQRAEQIDLQQIKSIKDPRLQLRRVAQEMESLMIKMMFKQMKKNVNKEGLLHGGFAEEIFDDFLTDEYAKQAARSQSLGIAEIIYNRYSKHI
ncbi:MAG TPA: rod-binding protein [Spirochaetota bacterium]|nr:rod-binding protein [Spirochaetota bacterium]